MGMDTVKEKVTQKTEFYPSLLTMNITLHIFALPVASSFSIQINLHEFFETKSQFH